MIVYYLTYDYDAQGKCHGAKAHRYEGNVTFVAGTSRVLIGTGANYQKRNRATVFDDTFTPPKLIREDYPLKKLRKFKYLELPASYIDDHGNIVSAKGDTLMEGPR